MASKNGKVPPYSRLGARLQAARNRTGLSQERFAPEVLTTRRTVIRAEKGHHKPHPALLTRWADRTETPLAALTNSDEDDEESDLARQLYTIVRAIIAQERVPA